MRITTQMLNETAKKTGISVNNTSLLNYINKDNDNSLLNSLQKSATQQANMAQKKSYEKLGTAADSLEETAKTLGSDEEDNIFAKAKESGSNSEIIQSIKTLIEQYNETRKQLANNPSSINTYYNQMLKQLADKNSEVFSEIGISIDKNGSMTVDENRLNAAKTDELEAVFGAKSEFTNKLEYMAAHISDSVTAEIESLGNQYGQDANSFSSYISSKYNWWS